MTATRATVAYYAGLLDAVIGGNLFAAGHPALGIALALVGVPDDDRGLGAP